MRRTKDDVLLFLIGLIFLTMGQSNAFTTFSPLSAMMKPRSTADKVFRPANLQLSSPAAKQLSRTTTSLSAAPATPSSQQFISFDILSHKLFKPIIIAFTTMTKVIAKEISSLSNNQKLLFLSSFLLGFAIGKVKPFWKRFTSVMDIPDKYFGPEAQSLVGRVASVSDGDTIRFLHTPTMFHPIQVDKTKKEKVSEIALPIRLCTIDAPETKKFGKPGQPFGVEAKERLQELLTGSKDKMANQKVHIRLLHKDQYGRAVAQVYKKRPFWKPVPLERKIHMDEQLLKEGLAEVYVGGGAVYGPLGKDEYLKIEEDAKKQKLGIWSQKDRESAADFKKRTK